MTALDVRIDRKFYKGDGQVGHLAIENLRFKAAVGEFLCILGPSGSGKTTTLNIIAGLDRDYDGQVTAGDGRSDPRLAYVFQSPRLLPWRSVLDNVELVLGDAADARERARALIAEVGLTTFEEHFPGQISLGMQRRAALARAFALEPSILLMDEPFVSLDEQAAEMLRSLLIDLWRARPTTIVFVTHDTREAIKLANRILVFSAAPARVVREIQVPLSVEERNDPQSVDSFRSRQAEALTQAVSMLSRSAGANGRGAGAA